MHKARVSMTFAQVKLFSPVAVLDQGRGIVMAVQSG